MLAPIVNVENPDHSVKAMKDRLKRSWKADGKQDNFKQYI